MHCCILDRELGGTNRRIGRGHNLKWRSPHILAKTFLERFEAVSSDCINHGFFADGVPMACQFNRAIGYCQLLAVCDEDGYVYIFNTRQGSMIAGSPCIKNGGMYFVSEWQAHENAAFDVKWINDDSQLLTASGDQTVALWDMATSTSLARFRGHHCSVRSVTARPGSAFQYASGARDGHIMFWDSRVNKRKTGCNEPVKTIKYAHSRAKRSELFHRRRKLHSIGCKLVVDGFHDSQQTVTCVLYQHENLLVSSGAMDGCVKFWDTRKWYTHGSRLHPVATLEYPGPANTRKGIVTMCMDLWNSKLFVSYTDSDVYGYDVVGGSPSPSRYAYAGHRNDTFFVRMAVSPDGQYLLSGSGKNMGVVWQVNTPQHQPTFLIGHTQDVSSVDWCPSDMSTLATLSDDMEMRIWRQHSREPGTENPDIVGFAYTPDVNRKYTRRARIHFARDDFPFRTMKRDEAFEAHKASILKASHMAPSIDRLPSACGEVYHGTRQKIRCSRVMECSPSHHDGIPASCQHHDGHLPEKNHIPVLRPSSLTSPSFCGNGCWPVVSMTGITSDDTVVVSLSSTNIDSSQPIVGGSNEVLDSPTVKKSISNDTVASHYNGVVGMSSLASAAEKQFVDTGISSSPAMSQEVAALDMLLPEDSLDVIDCFNDKTIKNDKHSIFDRQGGVELAKISTDELRTREMLSPRKKSALTYDFLASTPSSSVQRFCQCSAGGFATPLRRSPRKHPFSICFSQSSPKRDALNWPTSNLPNSVMISPKKESQTSPSNVVKKFDWLTTFRLSKASTPPVFTDKHLKSTFPSSQSPTFRTAARSTRFRGKISADRTLLNSEANDKEHYCKATTCQTGVCSLCVFDEFGDGPQLRSADKKLSLSLCPADVGSSIEMPRVVAVCMATTASHLTTSTLAGDCISSCKPSPVECRRSRRSRGKPVGWRNDRGRQIVTRSVGVPSAGSSVDVGPRAKRLVSAVRAHRYVRNRQAVTPSIFGLCSEAKSSEVLPGSPIRRYLRKI